jgi:phosphopantetheinyl transferase (holo-ACP synthase)
MSFDEALDILTRDERFHATVYAMNSLLIHKGIYTREEFETLFKEWAAKEARKKARSSQRPTAHVSLRA